MGGRGGEVSRTFSSLLAPFSLSLNPWEAADFAIFSKKLTNVVLHRLTTKIIAFQFSAPPAAAAAATT